MIYFTLFSYELKMINKYFGGVSRDKITRKKSKLWMYRPKDGRRKDEKFPRFKTSNLPIEFM